MASASGNSGCSLATHAYSTVRSASRRKTDGGRLGDPGHAVDIVCEAVRIDHVRAGVGEDPDAVGALGEQALVGVRCRDRDAEDVQVVGPAWSSIVL